MNDKLKKGIAYILAGIALLGGGYGGSQMLGAGVNTGERTVMDTAITTTTGAMFLMNDYRTIGVTVANAALTGTVKVACTMQKNATVSTTASMTNRWDYVELIELVDSSSLPGDTGLVVSSDSNIRQYEVNSNNFYACTAVLSPYTSGSTTIKFRPANNQ